jgi:hypothetical protein
MGQYAADAISTIELGALLSTASAAHTVGRLEWRALPVQMRGEVEVANVIPTLSTGSILMSIPDRRQWEINLVYRINGVPARRVDVNAKHNGWPLGTHQHQYRPADGGETCELLPTFPSPPISPLVEVEWLRDAFLGFAGLCHVAVSENCWTDPPWRR